MKKKILAITSLLTFILLAFYIEPLTDGLGNSDYQGVGLLPEELQILSMVNGSNICQYDLELEQIALNHYAFRSGGSPGANETAAWIVEKFRSFGVEAHNESFQFTNWNLQGKPALTTDEDGNLGTVGDQLNVTSFISDHLSWPTGPTGVFSDLVILPLPTANNLGEIGQYPINQAQWDSIVTTGKILLIGREVTWDTMWRQTFLNKISTQTPAAIVFTWWYSWMSFTPPFISSGGGRPLSGAYYWNLEIPVGWVNYQDGLTIRNLESSLGISARVIIDSEIGYGTHLNAVGKIAGYVEPEKYIIVSSHLDTVMVPGFCDNGAGTAGIVELARVLSEAIDQGLYRPRFSVLFVAFTDEELGLVGSINYLSRHKSEIGNAVAVINLDCIGSDNFEISETLPDPDTGIDLDDVVLKAAQDLSVAATVIEPGGSDQETFRNPLWAEGLYNSLWGLSAGISDAPPVEPSVGLLSFPLMYGDYWNIGVPGWIHTSYDNSTSTAALEWVEEYDLENHVKITALTLLRVSKVDDVAINSIVSKTIAGQGYPVRINVTVENQGDYTVTFNTTVYVNTTIIQIKAITLAGKDSAIIAFTWNTTGSAKGNYVISAYAHQVAGEIDTADNSLTDGTIFIRIPGDIALTFGLVDMKDIGTVVKAFGSNPGHFRWNPNADINGDLVVDMKDVGITVSNFGKTDL